MSWRMIFLAVYVTPSRFSNWCPPRKCLQWLSGCWENWKRCEHEVEHSDKNRRPHTERDLCLDSLFTLPVTGYLTWAGFFTSLTLTLSHMKWVFSYISVSIYLARYLWGLKKIWGCFTKCVEKEIKNHLAINFVWSSGIVFSWKKKKFETHGQHFLGTFWKTLHIQESSIYLINRDWITIVICSCGS